MDYEIGVPTSAWFLNACEVPGARMHWIPDGPPLIEMPDGAVYNVDDLCEGGMACWAYIDPDDHLVDGGAK